MKKIVLALLGIVLLAGVVYAAVEVSGNRSYKLQYKMIVKIETPEGIKTGSVVREIGNTAASVRLPGTGNPAGVRGEAVVVDLGKRGVLFALISHESDNEFYNAFPVPGNKIGNGGSSSKGIAYYKTLKPGDKGTLNPEFFPGYPRFVTFKDMNDPKSVQLVYVYKRDAAMFEEKADNFEKLFGKGVKLKDITLEITDEPITWGEVDNRLHWFRNLRKKQARLSGSTSIAVTTNDLADNLGAGSFSIGEQR